jgi:DNA-binding FadR family transcriptional regulator
MAQAGHFPEGVTHVQSNSGQERPAKLGRIRLSEQVALEIERRVVTEGLRPGDQLPTEPQLVDQYDVSRAVIREAGRLLVERGLVDIRPGRGMVVADFDGAGIARQYALLLELEQASFTQLMEMRQTIEAGMTEYAALRRIPDDKQRIRAALSSFADAGSDHQAALEADLAFHAAIAHASHNPFFIHIVNPVNDYLRGAYRTSLGYEAARSQTLAEHTAIAEAIFAGDAQEAGRCAREHLARIAATANVLVGKNEPEADGAEASR